MRKMPALKKKLFGLAALGSFAALTMPHTTPSAQADPPRYAPAWGYRDNSRKNDDCKNDRRNDRDRNDHHWNARDRNDRNRNDHRWNDRDRNDYRWNDRNRNDYYWNGRDNDRWNGRNSYVTFIGVVTDLESGSQFEMRSSGRNYDVYPDYNLRRRPSRGDTVRVSGYRVGNNGIRDARVEILRRD
jgi:hypothetical protein